MTSDAEGRETFADALQRISVEAMQVDEHERIGYLKGAIREVAGLSAPDRAALFSLLVTAGTGVRTASPTPGSTVQLNQTFAPQISQSNNQQVDQNASPQINQTANPQVSQAFGVATSDKRATSESRIQLLGALIGAIGLVGAAVVAARCTQKSEESKPKIADTSHFRELANDRAIHRDGANISMPVDTLGGRVVKPALPISRKRPR